MIKYLSITLLMFMTGFYSLCYSQEWVSTHRGTFSGDAYATNEAHDIAVTNSNYVYVTGFVTDTSGNVDMCIVKYTNTGQEVWSAIYNGTGYQEDKAYAITVDPVGYAYITGYSTGADGKKHITTIKYKKTDGTTMWVAVDSAAGDSKAYAITIDVAGNIVVTGSDSTSEGKRIVVIKYDSANGNSLWYNKFMEFYGSSANAIATTYGSDVYVTGVVYTSSLPESADMVTIKYNSLGVQQWVKTYNGTGNGPDEAKALVTDFFGNVYITGYSTGVNSGFDYCTIKYSSSGDMKWCSRYDGTGNSDDIANAIILANPFQNDPIVTGSSRSGTSDGTEDYVTIRYSSYNGDAQWVNRYNGTGQNSDIAYSLAVSPSYHSIYITGVSRHGIPEETEDMVTLKYNIFDGSTLDTAIYNGTADKEDVAYVVKVTRQNDVFVSGYTISGGDIMSEPSSMITMKYSQRSFTKDETISEIPVKFKLFQNYPNPFNPSTTIRFEIGMSSNVKITIYDMLGREVALPLNTYCEAGAYELNFSANGLASGVYFYEFKAGTYRDVKKMILMK